MHTTMNAHVEIFTKQPGVTSLSPHCAITLLLSPCGNVMTDYGAGTEQEMSHNLPDWFYKANCSVSFAAWMYFEVYFLILKS